MFCCIDLFVAVTQQFRDWVQLFSITHPSPLVGASQALYGVPTTLHHIGMSASEQMPPLPAVSGVFGCVDKTSCSGPAVVEGGKTR
jgi:hypothetical protein